MQKSLTIICFLFTTLLYKSYAQSDSLLTFSEIMFKPLANEKEFVEIYNTSETDTIDLVGFQLQYIPAASTLDNIIAHNNSTLLVPKSFAVILEGDYDFGSEIYDTLVPTEALIIKIDNGSFASGLSNSTPRTLLLINSSGDTVDTHTYSVGNDNGFSDEKIILNKDNSAANWGNSLLVNGTPGGKNSVSPNDFDLAINSINTFPNPIYDGNEILLSVEIENKGLLKSGQAVLELYDDFTGNNIPDGYEKFQTSVIDSLNPGQKISIDGIINNVVLKFYKIFGIITLSSDENNLNDTVIVTVEVSPKPRNTNDIVINEIMYAPQDGEPEWIEIFNRTGDEISLNDWRIADLSTSAKLSSINISPHSFLVFAKDASIFDYYDNLDNTVIVTSLPSLNNSSDAISLIDASGKTISVVNYFSSWGGNTGGKSLERISTENDGNSESNWGTSKSNSRATPGYINSITKKEFDLSISNFSIQPKIPFESGELNINLTIQNTGLSVADSFSVTISEELINSNNILFQNHFTNLNSGDSILINVKIDSLQLKQYYLNAEIIFNKDNDTINNKNSINFFPQKKPAEFNDIIINEIMYLPPNEEPEWVEILNNSSNEINLTNWKFGDRTTSLTISSDSVKLQPGEFLVLSEEESIKNFYEINSQVVVLKLPSLNNSGDDLYIYDQYGNIIDSVLYSSTWGGSSGNSLERINANDSSNSSANWKTAITKNKATPGIINSVVSRNYDLQIQSFTVEKDVAVHSTPVKISVGILNIGLFPSQNSKLNFYNDFNNDSAATENELINSILISAIEVGEIINYNFNYETHPSGKNLLIADLISQEDEVAENNIAFACFSSVIINEIRNDIIINEFVPAPSSGQPEWIELHNRSNKVIDLKNYKIADESSEIRVINKSTIVNPGEYFLIIGDSSFFNKYNTSSKFIIANFPSLNNSTDKIILLDSLNRVIDSLQYFSTWNGITGKSFERIEPEINSEISENWHVSKNKNGGTPGEINSVTQKSFDVGISQIYFNPQKPFYGNEVSVSALVKNYGKENASFKLNLIEENIPIEEAEISIPPNDSIDYIFHFTIEKLEFDRNFFISIEFDKDQDSTNNYLTANISPGYNYNSLIINEIMFTPQNGEPEWVEFYNREDYKINLSGWSISDILTTPVKTEINDSTFFIEPKSYLVITKDSLIINYHDFIPVKILVTTFANLNNSEDGVVIKDIYENLIDSVHYTSNWQTKTGYSIERISFEENSNDSSNWSAAIDIEQSTPGRLNSVSQKANDLAILDLSFSPPAPKFGSDVFINVTLKNEGFIEANNFSIKFYDRQNNNIFDEINIASLAKNDSMEITSNGFKIFDVENIFAEINFALDDNLNNNMDSILVVPGFNKNDILINEVMFNPDTDKPEWIELVNDSGHEINLFEWKVSDILPSPKEAAVTKENYKIFPSQYFIITNDTAAFRRNYNVEIPVFQCAFGSLGNSEDGIVIYDFYKNVIDSLFYTSEFGNAKGFSIERLSLSDGTNEINNWIVSINSDGSSPGFGNSVSESKSYEFNQVVINEIMYDPSDNNSEFIEFYNNLNEAVELGGWILENDKGEFFRIANSNYSLQPENYFVVAADSSFITFYDFTGNENFINILNEPDLGLTNANQLIILKDLKGNIIDSVNYNSKWHNPNVAETKNKSLERLNPKISSNESSNWSTSANTLGATPGKVNSIFADYRIENSGLTISPNPFSPDNDGFEDFCTINYNLGISLSQIRIKIFDDKGRLVRTLANNQPSGSTGSIIFSGLNENNSPLKIGMYIILFEATNSQTGQQEILKDVVVVARKL